MWVAQGIEKDLATQGPSVEEARSRFVRALQAHILDDVLDGRPPLRDLVQAPQHYVNRLGTFKPTGQEQTVALPNDVLTVRFLTESQPSTTKDRHRAIALYACAARDYLDFLEMLEEEETTIGCINLLKSMCALQQPNKGTDFELNRSMLDAISRVLSQRKVSN